ncbi:MAG: tetratricopeptide repeat protein [bacterium]
MVVVSARGGLLYLDALLGEGVEMLALGVVDEAFAAVQRVQEELEKRGGGGESATVPVDLLTRRVKALFLFSEVMEKKKMIDPALLHAIEANSIARGPLGDYPEYFVRSAVLLCRLYALKGDLASAGRYLADVSRRLAAADMEEDHQAEVSCAVGVVALAAGKAGVSRSAFGKSREILSGGDDSVERIVLRARVIAGEVSVLRFEKRDTESQEVAAGIFRELASAAGGCEGRLEFGSAVRLLGEALNVPCAESAVPAEEYCGAMFRAAFLLERKGKWGVAAGFYNRLAGKLEDAGMNGTLIHARTVMELGKIHSEMKDYERAEEFLRRAEVMGREAGGAYEAAIAKCYLGLNFSKKGSDDAGIECFNEALSMAPGEGDDARWLHLRGLVNNQLGFVERKRGRVEEAIALHDAVLELLEGQADDLERGEACRMLGECYMQRGQHIQADRALKKAVEVFERNGAGCEIAKSYKSIGLNFLGMGDMEKACYFIDESISLLERLKVSSDLPMLYTERGKICLLQEKYGEAEEYFRKDFELVREGRNPHSIAFSYYHLGKVRRLLERTHSGLDFLKRSAELFHGVGNARMEANALMELALCESSLKNVKLATDYCARAREIVEKLDSYEDAARLLMVRGIVLRDARRRQMSQRCFEDSVALMEKKARITPDLAMTFYEFALFWRDGGDKKRAEECLLNAIEIAGKLGIAQRVNTYMKALARISPEAGARAQLSQFMDRSAVEHLSRGKEYGTVRVERKNISILFTDIRGFTGISEKMGLDELSSFLDDFYNTVTQVVIKYQGRVNKFIGDEVMVLFNMDDELPDHPVWAVRAADALVRTMEEVSQIRQRRGASPIPIGVGVNTGEVLLGIFGSAIRRDYTAIGDCVNVAARLQAQAKKGEVVVSDSVYERVKDIVKAEDMGEKPLKGKGAPLRLWKLKEVSEAT